MADKKFEDMTLEEMDAALLESQAVIDKAIAVQHARKDLRDAKHAEGEADKVPPHVQAAIVKKAQSLGPASIAPKSAVGTPGK